MPEIKHQFTGGKMNKDLNERLIPNGEYRDALNVQVSTSEGSSVGAIQNILGNSLLPNQDFISPTDVCVGSVADEKNDKLYWFVTQKSLFQTNFSGGGSGWGVRPYTNYIADPWTFSNGRAIAMASTAGYMEIPVSGIVEGETYTMTYDVVVASTAGEMYLANHTTNASTLNSSEGSDNVSLIGERRVGTYSVSWLQGSSRIGELSIFCGENFIGEIDNISVKLFVRDSIVEFDTNNNHVSPVLVDTSGDVLKFNSNNLITGINVIDDLLFWTDNFSEPKKINIQRSIKDTDQSGTIHTNFENVKSEVNHGLIKEEHITVVKQGPKLAPAIELTSERSNNSGKIYTGIMKITSPPVPSLGYGADNLQNTSSFWTAINSGYNNRYNFSGLKVGSPFETQVETDINGESGFALDWSPGDTLLFKEFGGELFDETPVTPLTDYSVKAKIVSTGHNRFTDAEEELVQNGDFAIPNSDGTAPNYWVFQGGSGYLGYYKAWGQYILCDDADQWRKITQTPSIPFVYGSTNGAKYTVSIKVSDYSSAVPLSGALVCRIVGMENDATTGFPLYYSAPYITTAGTHTFTIDTSVTPSVNSGVNFQLYAGMMMIQAVKGVDSDGDNIDDVGVGFTGRIESFSIVKAATENARVRCTVLAVNNPPVVSGSEGELRFVVDKLDEQEKLFEFKFPRFAYRYQYQDREYSTMSPFSLVAFLPGSFDYHPKKGYNLGMSNRITSVKIKNFVANKPDGVVAIDILYKDDASPGIYVVDTIKPNQDGEAWTRDEYTVTSEQISGILPSNQSLRLWDAVPTKALAQDISGNRIIYGNYTQGYDLKYGDLDYYPDFNIGIGQYSNAGLNPKKSIKSLKEYQLGIVLVDKHGRETPVMSNKSGAQKLNKSNASTTNQIEVSFHDAKFPSNMKYFKFYIKETSGEYYNLAMDRHYNSEDDHVWISFPSSDRNKIDIDTYLILKKGIESNEVVAQEAKYKILDIKNEAPDFIKQTKTLIEERTHLNNNSDADDVFGNEVPLVNSNSFKMNYLAFKGESGSNLHEVKDDLYVDFTNATNNTSKRYKIAKITTDFEIEGVAIADAKYSVKLSKKFGDDIDFIKDSGSVIDGTVVNIYRYTTENSAKFDGRFFVKINIDNIFEDTISIPSTSEPKYRTVLSKKLYYLTPQARNNVLHSSNLTGQDRGVYLDYDSLGDPVSAGGTGGFGRFAPFFRNYNLPANNFPYNLYDPNNADGVGAPVDVGQYRFGYQSSGGGVKPWLRELAWVTTVPGDGGFIRTSAGGNTADSTADKKLADKYVSGSITDREGQFNEFGEQIRGDVWFIDHGPISYTNNESNKLDWGVTKNVLVQTDAQTGLSSGQIDIGVGGLYHQNNEVEGMGIGDEVDIANFFAIGIDGGNSNYQGAYTKSLVSKFYPGKQFRFKEDPLGNVYTIQPNVTSSNRLRWQTQDEFYVNGNGTSVDPATDSYISNSIQLSPNFTKNWKPRFINNSDGGGSVSWNPTGDAGIINSGLKLGVDHSTTGVWPGTNQPFVTVDSLVATDLNGLGVHTITTGMALTSHSNGTAWDGSLGTSSAPSEDYLIIKRIEEVSGKFKLLLSGYTKMIALADDFPLSGDFQHHIADHADNIPNANQQMIFRQPKMNGYSQYSVNRINAQWGGTYDNPTDGGVMAIGYTLEFIEPIDSEPTMPSNPAIWETETKQSTDLDIYYEASGLNPLSIESDATAKIVIPVISTVEHINVGGGINHIEKGTYVSSVSYTGGGSFEVTLVSPSDDPNADVSDANFNYTTNTLLLGSLVNTADGNSYIDVGDDLKFTKPNGDAITVEITSFGEVDANGRTNVFYISSQLYGTKTKYSLNWHNCYSFGNGVESNRIRDNFNSPFISNGVKVSTTLDGGYSEEHRTGGLIYSGIYNSNSSTNNLNQFIAAEKITKDVNPIYGSIQKLYSRNSDLVALCEDKCLRILANKDAVYNADGNPQLTANENVLGQTIPFSGEYGISKNPESFAAESYRVYFTDKQRGAVIRLSKDGLTPISNHGMRDWFKDNLKLSNKLIGSYDDQKEEYNLTLKENNNISFFNTQVVTPISTADAEILTQVGFAYNKAGVETSFKTPTGEILVDEAVAVLVGDMVSGGGMLPGASVISKSTGNGYHTLVLNYNSPSFANYAPAGVTNNNGATNSPLTGQPLYYTSSVSFSRLTSSQNKVLGPNVSDKTLSFKEDVKGWVSFKSFFPESGVNLANNYYTMYNGRLFKHHDESVDRNYFYGNNFSSSVNVILNDEPGSVKSFHTLGYEGSQSKVDGFITDATTGLSNAQPYNLTPKDGWFVSGIETDKQVGNIHEFIEKEGKWFNYIKGVDSDITSETDFGAFDIQGIGILKQTITSVNSADYLANYANSVDIATIEGIGWNWLDGIMEFDNSINTSLQIGDIIYFQTPTVNGAFNTISSSSIAKYGDVTNVTKTTITVNPTGSNPVAGDYIMFAKNHAINTSSLIGYFADVKFENNSTGKIELFSVGSEVTESSK